MLKDSDNIEELKKHRIIALVDNSEFGLAALAHGFKFAQIFRADLCIIEPNKSSPNKKIMEALEMLNAQCDCENQIVVFTPDLQGSIKKKLFQYAETEDAIILVLPASRIKGETLFTHKSGLKLIQKSRIPCVVTGLVKPTENAYKNIVLPLDSLRLSKEKSLWAGYFSRFYKAKVHVLIASYKDDYLVNKVLGNLKFTQKIYANLEIDYQIHNVGEIEQDIDEYALSYAPKVNGSLVLVMTTRFFTFFDLFLGPAELKVIANSQQMPVMCINQRDDLYVLCT